MWSSEVLSSKYDYIGLIKIVPRGWPSLRPHGEDMEHRSHPASWSSIVVGQLADVQKAQSPPAHWWGWNRAAACVASHSYPHHLWSHWSAAPCATAPPSVWRPFVRARCRRWDECWDLEEALPHAGFLGTHFLGTTPSSCFLEIFTGFPVEIGRASCRERVSR